MNNNKKNKNVNEKKRFDAFKIILVGVGGTGGLFASTLARYIYSMKQDESKSFCLSLVDADRVAEHNICRQPFTADDVNQFKVDCLAEAFSDVYGISVNSVPTYIDDEDDLKRIAKGFSPEVMSPQLYDVYRHTILIGGVDNHRARQVMHSYFDNYKCYNNEDILYIDSANEYDFGTCVCGYKDTLGEHCPPRAFFFPDVLTDRGKSASELSCGEVNVSAPQHLATNSLAANVIFSRFVNFVTSGEYVFGVTTFYPFMCQMVHRDAAFYGIEDYHKKWLEHTQAASNSKVQKM